MSPGEVVEFPHSHVRPKTKPKGKGGSKKALLTYPPARSRGRHFLCQRAHTTGGLFPPSPLLPCCPRDRRLRRL
jgi:hypothetical protein